MAEVSLKRRALREQIRHQHLNSHFSQQRSLIYVTPPQQARQILIQALRGIKFTIEKTQSFDTNNYLRQYKSIAQKYHVSETLLSQVLFSYKLPAVERGFLPLQCSWAEIFLYLVQNEENPTVQEELLKILSINTYQLRTLSVKNIKKIIPILRETIEKVPFQWCSNRNLWFDMCQLLGELLISAQLFGIQMDFQNEQFGVISFLQMISNDHIFRNNLKERQIFIEVSLFALNLANKRQNQKIRTFLLRQSLTTLVVQNLENGWLEFDKNCEYFRRLFLSGDYLDEQLQAIIGEYFRDALSCNSSKYFELLNTIMSIHGVKLNADFCRQLSRFVFRSLKQDEDQTLEMKKWMVIMLKRQVQNSQNTQEYVKILLDEFLQNIDTLPAILEAIKTNSVEIYHTLVQLIAKILIPIYSTQEIPMSLLQLFIAYPELQYHLEETNLAS